VLYTVSLAHEVMIVTTPEPTAMTDAYATIKVLASTQKRRSIQLVVNQKLPTADGRQVRNQLQQVIDRFVSPGLDAPLTLDLVGEVPSDAAVRDAVRRRQLLGEAFPGSPAALAVAALAARLAPAGG
jgi:flagellar biosynthesis protein FlhG